MRDLPGLHLGKLDLLWTGGLQKAQGDVTGSVLWKIADGEEDEGGRESGGCETFEVVQAGAADSLKWGIATRHSSICSSHVSLVLLTCEALFEAQGIPTNPVHALRELAIQWETGSFQKLMSSPRT